MPSIPLVLDALENAPPSKTPIFVEGCLEDVLGCSASMIEAWSWRINAEAHRQRERVFRTGKGKNALPGLDAGIVAKCCQMRNHPSLETLIYLRLADVFDVEIEEGSRTDSIFTTFTEDNITGDEHGYRHGTLRLKATEILDDDGQGHDANPYPVTAETDSMLRDVAHALANACMDAVTTHVHELSFHPANPDALQLGCSHVLGQMLHEISLEHLEISPNVQVSRVTGEKHKRWMYSTVSRANST